MCVLYTMARGTGVLGESFRQAGVGIVGRHSFLSFICLRVVHCQIV